MRVLPSIAAMALLLVAGCTDNYGRVDYGRTALLGVGVGAAAALAAGALSDQSRPHRGNYGRRDAYGYGGYGGGYRRPYYGRGGGYGGYGGGYGGRYGGGYGRPYRGGW